MQRNAGIIAIEPLDEVKQDGGARRCPHHLFTISTDGVHIIADMMVAGGSLEAR